MSQQGDVEDTGDEAVVGFVRSPTDVLRLATFAIAAVVLIALARWAQGTVAGVEEDVVDLVSSVPDGVQRAVNGVAHLVALVAVVVVFVPALVLRRYRLLGYVVAGNALTALLTWTVTWWLDRDGDALVERLAAQRGGVDVADPRVLAQLAAAFVVLGPFVSARWRRGGAIVIWGLVVARLLVTAHLPTLVLTSLAIGAAAGSVVLLVLGRPDRRPATDAVAEALRSGGLEVVELARASVDARGSTPYMARLADGSGVFAKALSPDERSADVLFRAYRRVRLRDVGDERPFSTLRRAVEHEALMSLLARDAGVRTPRVRALATVGDDGMVLALDRIDGRTLSDLPSAAVTDDLLRQLWEQVRRLRHARLAHRDLRRANVFVADDGAPWVIDFGFSEAAADDRLLAADVAQLLVATALAVGARRAVATAAEVLGADAVGDAHPLLQPAALSGATRTALEEHPDLLAELRTAVTAVAPDAPAELATLDRVTGRTVLTVVAIVVAIAVLVPQLSDVSAIVDQVRDARWGWFVPVLVASVVTYLGAAVALVGSTGRPLPFGPTVLAQVASSFASKLAPAGMGGLALNTRFLQRAGSEPAAAVASVGMNAVAGAVVHVSLLLVLATWAGADSFASFSLPDPTVALVGVGAVAVLAAVALAVRPVRERIVTHLVPAVRGGVAGVAEVLHRPGRLAQLLGGSTIVTAGYIVALAASIQAFGGSDLSVAQVGAIYLAAHAVASAAPTPGGIGALEAAVIAGLVAAGMDDAVAVPSVFLYRLATFWAPVAPGWAAFTYLQRREYV